MATLTTDIEIIDGALHIDHSFKNTLTVPDKALTVALGGGVAVVFSEKGAMLTMDAELGPINLLNEHVSIGGTKSFDIHLGPIEVKGSGTLTA